MKIKTKIVSLLLVLLLLITCIPLSSCDDDDDDTPTNTDDEEFSGSIADKSPSSDDTSDTSYTLPEGDDGNVIHISSYEELKEKIAQKGTFILDSDIEITDNFTPIGNYDYPFLGTFNGNGHKITVTIKEAESGSGFSPTYKFVYCGLFGVIKDTESTKASIKNLTVDISCDTEATTSYCFVLAGGISGYMLGGEINNCTVNGEIKAKSEFFNAYCGGIVGIMQGGKVENCTSNATLNAHDSQNRATAGGIVAYAFNDATVSHCTATGNVKSTSTSGVSYAGGIVGHTLCASFTACGAFGDVYSEVLEYDATDTVHGAVYGGGLVGFASGISTQSRSSFVRCYAALENVTVKGNNTWSYAAGIAANVTYGTFEHCYSLCDVNLSSGLNICQAASAFVLTPPEKGSNNIKGCFSKGSVYATHSMGLVSIGTFYEIIKDETNEVWANAEKIYYNDNASFKLNGKELVSTSTGYYETGTKATEEELSSLDFCCEKLGWSLEDWEADSDGVFRAK